MFIPFVTTRYLFSHKRHNTINLIIAVSIVGVAVGTMALVAVLSVLNGFERVVENSFTAFDPELKIIPQIRQRSISNEPTVTFSVLA